MYSNLSLSFAVLTGEMLPPMKMDQRVFARATSMQGIKLVTKSKVFLTENRPAPRVFTPY